MVYLGHLIHYGHKNIVRGTTTWDLTPKEGSIHNGNNVRDFDTVEQMNVALIKGINDHVKQDDVLYFCGDWSFAGIENIWNFRKQLIVKEIHYILGNHCHHLEVNNFICEAGCNAQDLFTSVQHYKRISIDGQSIVLFHYPMRSWENMSKGGWALTGHCHNSMKGEYGKSLDIGVDTVFEMFGEYRPFSFEEIRKIMNKREIMVVDHHVNNR